MTREQFLDHFAVTWLATRAAIEYEEHRTVANLKPDDLAIQEAAFLADAAWEAWTRPMVRDLPNDAR